MRALAPVLLLAAASGAAQTPYLVADINTARPGTEVHSFTEVAGTAFFVASAVDTGSELWRSDGSAAGTALVRDIEPGPGSASLRGLTALGGELLFFADTAGGTSLWRSDGTSAGTVELLRLEAAPAAVGAPAVLGGVMYFVLEGASRPGLYRSDGSPAGTFLLAPAFAGAVPVWQAGGRLFYVNSSAATGAELWTSDGTILGTRLVHDIHAGAGSAFDLFPLPGSDQAADLGGRLHFRACEPATGCELWSSDGSAAGTTRVKDLLPGPAAGLPPYGWRFAVAAGQLFFAGMLTATEQELFRSDGTPGGTLLVRDLASTASSDPRLLQALGGAVFFTATVAGERALWRSDGSFSGTWQLTAGASVLDISYPTWADLGGALYFTAADFSVGQELWRSDGTPAGTALLADLVPGSAGCFPVHLTRVGARLFFSGAERQGRSQLWSSDGSAAGTSVLTYINASPGDGSSPAAALPVEAGIVFEATDSTGSSGIWFSDGSPGSAARVPAGCGSPLGCLRDARPLSGAVCFPGNDAAGTEPWRTDGTAAGTFPLADICTPGCSSFAAPVAESGGRLYLATSDQLWLSDATPAGTRAVTLAGAMVPAAGAGADLGGALVFRAGNREGNEPWRSDGTEFGTWPLADLCPGSCSSEPAEFVRVGDFVFFTADDRTSGRELWVTGGTQASTRLVKELCPGSCSSRPGQLTAMGNLVFFVASEGAGSISLLMKTDGSAAGTTVVSPAVRGLQGSVRILAAAGGRLFFAWNDGALGDELWLTDGTGAGTRMVADLWPGLPSSYPSTPLAVGGTLYFTAGDPGAGHELWRSDGSFPGTRRIADLRPGAETSGISWLARSGARLYFPADVDPAGKELWALELPERPAALLRNAAVRSLSPPQPALATLLPLDPARDAYLDEVFPGDVDPDAGAVVAPGRPLVFYALAAGGTLKLVKTPLDQVGLSF